MSETDCMQRDIARIGAKTVSRFTLWGIRCSFFATFDTLHARI
jgi:hypothetical protein